VKRTLLFVALAALYATAFQRVYAPRDASGLDPVGPKARQIESAIESRAFADALPLAREMQTAYPQEPLVDYWLAVIYRGLDRTADEVTAWNAFSTHGGAPREACPDVAEAQERLGQHQQALEVCP
jgi:hypothetical protein